MGLIPRLFHLDRLSFCFSRHSLIIVLFVRDEVVDWNHLHHHRRHRKSLEEMHVGKWHFLWVFSLRPFHGFDVHHPVNHFHVETFKKPKRTSRNEFSKLLNWKWKTKEREKEKEKLFIVKENLLIVSIRLWDLQPPIGDYETKLFTASCFRTLSATHVYFVSIWW